MDGDHQTSVEGASAFGDVTHGQNQSVTAMSDGATAGCSLREDLRRYLWEPAVADSARTG